MISMKIKKKLTRKQFLAQEDEFIVFMKNAIKWIKKNLNLIVFSVIGLGIIFAVAWGIRFKIKSDLQKSTHLYNEIRAILATRIEGNAEGNTAAQGPDHGEKIFSNQEEKFKAASTAIDQLLELYPSSKLAEDSLYLKAEALYEAKKLDEAITQYNLYLDKYRQKGAYRIQSLASLGYLYQDKEDYPKSIESFQKILDTFPDYLLKDTIYIALGRCYEHTGQMEKAKVEYQRIITDFPDSSLAEEAKGKIDKIDLAASAPPKEKVTPESIPESIPESKEEVTEESGLPPAQESDGKSVPEAVTGETPPSPTNQTPPPTVETPPPANEKASPEGKN